MGDRRADRNTTKLLTDYLQEEDLITITKFFQKDQKCRELLQVNYLSIIVLVIGIITFITPLSDWIGYILIGLTLAYFIISKTLIKRYNTRKLKFLNESDLDLLYLILNPVRELNGIRDLSPMALARYIGDMGNNEEVQKFLYQCTTFTAVVSYCIKRNNLKIFKLIAHMSLACIVVGTGYLYASIGLTTPTVTCAIMIFYPLMMITLPKNQLLLAKANLVRDKAANNYLELISPLFKHKGRLGEHEWIG